MNDSEQLNRRQFFRAAAGRTGIAAVIAATAATEGCNTKQSARDVKLSREESVAKYGKYRDQLAEISGRDIKIIPITRRSKDSPDKHYDYLAIAIGGDRKIADEAIDKLVDLRAKAGLRMEDMPFDTLSTGLHYIVISASEVDTSSAKNGKSPFERLSEEQKREMRKIIEDAIRKAQKPKDKAPVVRAAQDNNADREI